VSDNITTLIPQDPRFVPTKKARDAAVRMLRALAPRADEITSGVDDEVSFRDCGGNFESVACPRCRKKIELETWQGWMFEDGPDDGGFRLGPLTTPCCKTEVTLNDLVYDWPQGFSRYYLSARNAGARFPVAVTRKLEDLLGCKLRVIRQRL
jgi:hypothetical protein